VPRGLPDPKQLGIYFTLAYVGMEMVAPLVAGLILDDQFGPGLPGCYLLQGCRRWGVKPASRG